MSGQGAAIGAATGATYGLATGKDPLKYAMIGGAIGGTGGAAIPGLSTAGATAAGTTAATGAATGATGAATAGNLAAVPAFGAAPFQVGASAVPSAGVFSGGGTAALGGISPMTAAGPSSGMIPSSLAQPTLMDSFTSGLESAGQFTQQNPVLTQMGMQTAQQMMQQPQAQMAPAGQVSRGQIQGGDYMSLLNPQQGSVIRPQPISLLG